MLQTTTRLMEETGKPIIHVPDTPVHGEITAGARFTPVVLGSPRSAAQALTKMAWYAEYCSSVGGVNE
jgi:hypothetical protein